MIIHRCRVIEGIVKPKVTADFVVNEKARNDTAKNHTATHMLHATLKEVLGNHVEQKGSLVAPERLRFDFTNPGAVTSDQLTRIEEIMNERIWKNASAKTEVLPYEKAVQSGATALFGEKYGDVVRVLSIGDYSKEFCGGTHLTRTGDIGMFKIVKETSVSAGIRRIEAFTSHRAFRYLHDMQKQILDLSQALGVPSEKIGERIEKIMQAQKDAKKSGGAKATAQVSEGSIQKIGNVSVYEQVMDVENPKDLRDIADRCMEKLKEGVVVLGAKTSDKVFLVVKVSKGFTAKIKAGDLVKQAASIVGGSGGGREDFAQAGGSDISKLDQAMEHIRSIISKA